MVTSIEKKNIPLQIVLLIIMELDMNEILIATNICRILNSAGFESYFVGGHVRDMLMEKESNDVDIATNATPEIVVELFSVLEDYTVVPTGILHGTVTIIKDSIHTEVTTYRKDLSCDGRNATVEFAKTIEEDLSRRDFVINSIAYNPLTEKFIDPYNGRKDIENRLIRCVGYPMHRFREDYLRLFRALRFKSTLNFDTADMTWQHLCEVSKDNFSSTLSIERVRDEINKCFKAADCPSDMIDDMHDCGLLDKYLPELSVCHKFEQNKYHKYDVYWHTLFAIDAVPKEFPLIRWAALFHDLGKPKSCENYGTPTASFHNHEFYSEEIARDIMKRFRFSNYDMEYVANLVKHHMFKCDSKMKDGAIRRFVCSLGIDYVDDICILKYADRKANGLKTAEEMNIDNTGLKRRFTEILKKDCAFKIKDLAISGKDIIEEFNIAQGPLIGRLLKECFEIVLENPELNKRNTLLLHVNYLIFTDQI